MTGSKLQKKGEREMITSTTPLAIRVLDSNGFTIALKALFRPFGPYAQSLILPPDCGSLPPYARVLLQPPHVYNEDGVRTNLVP